MRVQWPRLTANFQSYVWGSILVHGGKVKMGSDVYLLQKGCEHSVHSSVKDNLWEADTSRTELLSKECQKPSSLSWSETELLRRQNIASILWGWIGSVNSCHVSLSVMTWNCDLALGSQARVRLGEDVWHDTLVEHESASVGEDHHKSTPEVI